MQITSLCSFRIRLFAGLAGLLCAGINLAQIDDFQLPILLDADTTDYDGKNSMLTFQGLRLTQGSLGIQADAGRASKMDFEDSVWHFNGNVVVDVENGHIECDDADLSFSGYELRTAVITGNPATFEMQRPDSDDKTYAEANRLEYDFDSGVVTFSGQATITQGGNQISSAYLVYNIAEQRINAQSGGDGDPKVRITYTPGAVDNLVPDGDTEDEETIPENETPDDIGDDSS